MKIRIDVQSELQEDEVLIRCSKMNDQIQKIHQFILDQNSQSMKIVFYKQNTEYYFALDQVLFFETEGDQVYAHTKEDSYKTKYRLYELEQLLPGQFVRVSKSTILNSEKIHSLQRNLAAASLVEFQGTHKHVYVSRRYYAALRQRLRERSFQ